jgi:hypothetical protein
LISWDLELSGTADLQQSRYGGDLDSFGLIDISSFSSTLPQLSVPGNEFTITRNNNETSLGSAGDIVNCFVIVSADPNISNVQFKLTIRYS